MSGHGANPIQFSLIKKNKDWASRTLANASPTSDNISFLSYHQTPPPFKVDVICGSPLVTIKK